MTLIHFTSVIYIAKVNTIRLETKKRMQINKGVCGCLVLYPTCWLQPWCLCSWWTSQQIQWRKTSLCWYCSPESSALQGETLGQNSCQWSNYINKRKQFYAPWWINAIQKLLCWGHPQSLSTNVCVYDQSHRIIEIFFSKYKQSQIKELNIFALGSTWWILLISPYVSHHNNIIMVKLLAICIWVKVNFPFLLLVSVHQSILVAFLCYIIYKYLLIKNLN